MTAKRMMDMLGSVAGLCLLGPLMLLIAVAVRLRDGGPALFRQQRVGRGGRVFEILKYRTMVVDAERRGRALTVGQDPRITPLGHWLRKLKLDELPQLINVLRGEMSLIGPRPEVPLYVALYTSQQRRVLDLQPGITDPASIAYRHESELLAASSDPERTYVEQIMPHKIRLNLRYAATANAWTDLKVILATLWAVGATGDRHVAGPRRPRHTEEGARTGTLRNSAPTICFLSAEHPAEDKRVFQKEAVSLAAAGFRVVHLCPGASDGAYESRGVQIVTYHRESGRWRRLVSLIGLFRRARQIRADAYHCNEPDSWVVGVALRLVDRRPVVFDCHEHYPGQVARWLPWIVRRPGVWATRFLLQALGLCTNLIVLAKYSVADDFSWSRRRQLVVLNTTPLSALGAMASDAKQGKGGQAAHGTHETADDVFTFVHIGVIRRERGSEQLLAAMAELKRRGVAGYRVTIIGEFKDGSEQAFCEAAQCLGVRGQIELHRWLPFSEAFALVRRSHAGLILFQKTLSNNVRGMPHKMFDYMLAGLPVIAPDFAPDIVGVLRPAAAGMLVDTANAQALADAMQSLIRDRDAAQAMGQRGRAAVAERYHWEYDAATLIAAYGRLLRLPRTAAAEAPLRRAA